MLIIAIEANIDKMQDEKFIKAYERLSKAKKELEQAEGWQILINIVLTITTGITIWMLGRVKEVIKHERQKRKSTRSTKNIFNV
ncbi:MAG: hypothetical protein E7C93_00650 [Veillonella sp.]|nr:hypothetical protein [Veillonella sp.]MDU2576035.1 hypothetical protein [Veillonella sp.]